MQILLNRIETPDGTVLTSYHRHDYRTRVDKVAGETYMVDGGTEYIRRSVNTVKAKDLTVYLSGDHAADRKAFHRGQRAFDGRNHLRYTPLKDLETDHIKAILETQRQIQGGYIEKLMKAELEYRDNAQEKHSA